MYIGQNDGGKTYGSICVCTITTECRQRKNPNYNVALADLAATVFSYTNGNMLYCRANIDRTVGKFYEKYTH